VQLNGTMVVAGSRVQDVHLVRSGREGGLGVADLLLQRLTHEQNRPGSDGVIRRMIDKWLNTGPPNVAISALRVRGDRVRPLCGEDVRRTPQGRGRKTGRVIDAARGHRVR
jgi:hypothetical protein